MVRCIAGARMTMIATVATKVGGEVVNGKMERFQDPDSGEILNRLVPSATPGKYEGEYEFPCYARGYTDLGFRSSANRESYLKGDYTVFEAIDLTYPARYPELSRQSYITSIRDAKTNNVLWKEVETGKPTVFQVQGMTPIYDPFGKLREWTGVVTRAEIQ